MSITTSQVTIRYQYSPFKDQRSIRLLLLQQGRTTDAISIDLVEAPLSRLPEYEALSYVWGSPMGTIPIYCNNLSLLVTENCLAALKQLRHAHRCRVLWIDAICIDQSCEAERNSQVQLMGDIYSSANCILVWLGEASKWSDYSLSFLDEYGNVSSSKWPSFIRNYFLDRKIRKQIELETAEGEVNELQIFSSIVDRPWFTRLWTVQEYVLSREVHFLCGESMVNGDRFFSVIPAYVNRRRNKHGEPRYNYPYGDCVAAYEHFFDIMRRKLKQGDQEIISITSLFSKVRTQKATNPKDAIYGMYGLLLRHEVQLSPVDYSLPFTFIFTQATASAITHDKSLHVLLDTSASPDWPVLPSWVPSWHLPGRSGFFHYQSERGNYNATRYSDHQFKVFVEESILSTQGMVIDTIETSAKRSFPESEYVMALSRENLATSITQTFALLSDIRNTYQSWVEAVMTLKSYPTGVGIEEALRHTLTHYSSVPGAKSNFKERWSGNPEMDENTAFDHWLKSFPNAKKSASVKPGKPNNPSTDASGHSSASLSAGTALAIANDFTLPDRDVAAYNSVIAAKSTGTKLFTTSAGYMGKGLTCVEEGDAIILIAGLEVPFVARKVVESTTYRVLGPAYVDGIMEGERWPDDEKECIEIRLR